MGYIERGGNLKDKIFSEPTKTESHVPWSTQMRFTRVKIPIPIETELIKRARRLWILFTLFGQYQLSMELSNTKAKLWTIVDHSQATCVVVLGVAGIIVSYNRHCYCCGLGLMFSFFSIFCSFILVITTSQDQETSRLAEGMQNAMYDTSWNRAKQCHTVSTYHQRQHYLGDEDQMVKFEQVPL